MRRIHHVDLREAMRTMYWRDLVVLLDDAAEQDTQSAHDSENLAMLLDRWDFFLNGDYVDRITDPNDPEVKAEAERRKAAGIVPPPIPLLRPVALRRPEIAAVRKENYEALADRFAAPQQPRRPDRGARASTAEFLAWERSRATTP